MMLVIIVLLVLVLVQTDMNLALYLVFIQEINVKDSLVKFPNIKVGHLHLNKYKKVWLARQAFFLLFGFGVYKPFKQKWSSIFLTKLLD